MKFSAISVSESGASDQSLKQFLEEGEPADLLEGKIFAITWESHLSKRTPDLALRLKFPELNDVRNVADQELDQALRQRNVQSATELARFNMFRLLASCNLHASNPVVNVEGGV